MFSAAYSAEGKNGTEEFITLADAIQSAGTCQHEGLGDKERCCVAKAVMAVNLVVGFQPETKYVDEILIRPANIVPYRNALRTLDIQGNSHIFVSEGEALLTVDYCITTHEEGCHLSHCKHAQKVLEYLDSI